MKSRVQRSTERQRRALAGAMIVSVAIHVAAFAFLGLRTPPGQAEGDDRTTGAENPADRYLAQKPLQVVRLATQATTGGAGASRAMSGSGESAASKPATGVAAALALLLPAQLRTTTRAAPNLELVEEHPVSMEGIITLLDIDWDASTGFGGEQIAFEPASKAAKRAAKGKRRGVGARRRTGISIVLGGGGAGCDVPTLTGIFDNFAGAPGAPGRIGGRQ